MVQAAAQISDPGDFLWDLPKGWNWRQLHEIASIHDSGRKPVKKEERIPGFIPYCGANGIIDSVSSFTHEGEFVLLAEDGGFYSAGEASAYLMNGQFWANNHVHILKGLEEVLDNRWLIYALNYLDLTKYLTGATRPKLTQGAMLRIRLPVPSNINIQRRIVARIEVLLAEVRASRELLDEMRRDCERLLAVALNDVLKKLENVTEKVRFSEIATAFNGRASGTGNSDIRVFKTRHVYPHTLRLEDPTFAKPEQVSSLPTERFLQPGDVLMANIAEGTLGRVTYVHECDTSWTVDTQIMILRSKNEQELLGKWLYYYLWSERGQQDILSRRTGIAFADKRGQTHIYPKNIEEIPIPKPPIHAQKQAVFYLDSILDETQRMLGLMNQDGETLTSLEQSILERAFRGKL